MQSPLDSALIDNVSNGVSFAATVGVRHKATPQSSRIRLSVADKQIISFYRLDLP